MAQPFTFPPPPPPPPRKESQSSPGFASSNYAASYGTGARARGNRFARGRGRGDAIRGLGFTGRWCGSRGIDGQDRGTGGFSHSHMNDSKPDLALSKGLNHHNQSLPQTSPSPYHGPKRHYSVAFNNPPPSPRPHAAPAVPSFGGDILAPSASKSKSSAAPKKKRRKHNQLGLTPLSVDHESSSDEDEEAKLATKPAPGAVANPNLLQFEYKGRTATLQTAADIAAWIAERKKKFPTAAKAEAAKIEAEERRMKWKEIKEKEAEAQRLQKLDREKARQEDLRQRALQSVGSKKPKKEEENGHIRDKGKGLDEATKTALKTERLKRKLEKAQREARKAEEALARMQVSNAAISEDRPEEAASSAVTAKSPAVATVPPPAAGEIDESKASPSDEIAKLKAELLQDEAVSSSHESATSSDVTLSDLDECENGTESDATSSAGPGSGSGSGSGYVSTSSSESGTDSSSDAESNSSPEELTSKRTAPDRLLPPTPPPRTSPRKQAPQEAEEDKGRVTAVCRNMLRGGRCQFGHRCRFSHDISGKESGPTRDGDGRQRRQKRQGGAGRQGQEEGSRGDTGRKGLYQIMVEREVEEERRAAVEVIIAMGERGMLEEPGTEKMPP